MMTLMHSEAIRHLKHELRTPINHIVGYSSLLIETAQEEGDEEMAASAGRIMAAAANLTKAVERTFIDRQEFLSQADIASLHSLLAPLIQKIDETIPPALSSETRDSYSSDLTRIKNATGRLRGLLATLVAPG